MPPFFYSAILKLIRFSIVGHFPSYLKKYIVIVAPHTSNWDFLLGLLARGIQKEKIGFLGKSSLFKPGIGWLFRWLGGHPVERSKRTKLVDQVVAMYNNAHEFKISLTPEGTRKQVKEWKSGFYYIAIRAGIPIVPVAFDWGKREIRIYEPFEPTGQYDQDLPRLKAYFVGSEGKTGEKFDMHA
jgi:1-acyl-sn-glycerol-3-phosphate acyltransferase